MAFKSRKAQKAYQKRWQAANREKSRAAEKRYQEKNRVARAEAELARYHRSDKTKIAARIKLKRASRPDFRLAHYLRVRLREALRGSVRAAHSLELLGMEPGEFRIYMQGQFRPGMTWENYGPVWHADHVRPCASFNLSDPEQQKICFRWDNYQPLFAKENLQKSDKWQ